MPDIEAALRTVQPAARLSAVRRPLPEWGTEDSSPVLWLPPTRSPDPLRAYWRMLVQGEVLRQLAGLTDAEATQRLAKLGADAAAEVRLVLVSDHVIPADAPPVAVYRAFAAVGTDVLAFEPIRFGRLFPLLGEATDMWKQLLDELGVVRLMAQLKPPGAAAEAQPVRRRGLGGVVQDVSATASLAVRRGNKVRAAVALARAGDPAAARTLRDGLVADLAAACGWDAATADCWDAALRPLLAACREPGFGRAVRCLYDLQRIVGDLSEEPAALDPWGWLVSRGRRPLVTPRPHLRNVRLLRHLATARAHLRHVELDPADRARLDELAADAQHAAEAAVRADGEPRVWAALADAGLVPVTEADHVAATVVAAELFDKVAERGNARFADLRDAVARNQLKLPDLGSVGEWWKGDALLLADRRLGELLPGVYRPGEAYLRAIHRGIAALFGWAGGRWAVLWLLLPFGGGLMAVVSAKAMALEVGHFRHWLYQRFGELDAAVPVEHPHGGLTLGPVDLAVALGLGVLFLALVHRPGFRRRFLSLAGQLLQALFVRLPLTLWRAPPVRAVRESAVWREVGPPLVVAGCVAVVLAVVGSSLLRIVGWAGATFAVLQAVSFSPAGRRWRDRVVENVGDLLMTAVRGLIPGVLALFREIADRIERGLYAVDEWLRYRDRDGKPTLALKAALATLWQPLAYVLRFVFYLLAEPQVNPVKHFPVVTVGHKLMLPTAPTLASAVGSKTLAGAILTGTPGIFGFVAWELKEGWRLYAANRPAEPPPAVVGHHGETVRGLLVPGFHRGTVPKLFAKLRKPDPGDADHQLHEVEHAVGRFVERHLAAPLRRAAGWEGLTPDAGPVALGVRTLAVTLAVKQLGADVLRVTFANDGGRVTARVEPAGWTLSEEQSAVLTAAVASFVRLGGSQPDALAREETSRPGDSPLPR